MRVDYRWIVFPKAAINGGADSGNSPRGQHQIVSYQRTASGSALDCKEKVGPVVREKSERSREIWGISVLLRGLASGGFYGELALQLRVDYRTVTQTIQGMPMHSLQARCPELFRVQTTLQIMRSRTCRYAWSPGSGTPAGRLGATPVLSYSDPRLQSPPAGTIMYSCLALVW